MTKRQPPADTYASDYIPPHAVICWTDDEAVYCAIPTVSGPPLINRYTFSEGGLSKALSILKVERTRALRHGRVEAKRSAPPPVTKIEKVKADDATREEARAVLKKLGILS